MKITIEITTGNAAFADAGSGSQTAAILRELTAWLDGAELGAGLTRTLRDANGNKVGEFNTAA